MHRTHSQHLKDHGDRLLAFHREHGISDNRVAAAPTPAPVRYATLRAVPPTARASRPRLALRLVLWAIVGALTGIVFELLVIEPLIRATLQAQS